MVKKNHLHNYERRNLRRRGWGRFCYVASIGVIVLFITEGRATTGNPKGTAATQSEFHYQPFSEAEITAALQKPLTLDDCIRIALAKNIPLEIAKDELIKSEASHSGSYGMFFPLFSLHGLTEKEEEVRSPAIPGAPDTLSLDNRAIVGSVDQLLPTGARLNFAADLSRDWNSPDRFGALSTRTRNRIYSVSLAQPLLRGAWPTVVSSPIATADYDRQMQDKELFDVSLQTVFLVKRAFYELLLQRELIEVSEAAIKRDSTLLEASKSKAMVKLATRRDVLSAEIQLAEDKVTLIKSQTNYQNALDALKEVLGVAIEVPIEVAESELDYSVRSLDENVLIQQAQENNPLLQRAQVGIARRQLQVTVAKNERLPRLDLVGSYSGSLESDTDQDLKINTTGWQFAFIFSYPFLNREASANTEVARANLSQQQNRAVDLERQIMLNIRSIVRNTYSRLEEIKTLERSIEAAEQKLAFASTMFNLGRASNLDITDAQEALLKSQSEYMRSLVDYHIQLALLESLTGRPISQ